MKKIFENERNAELRCLKNVEEVVATSVLSSSKNKNAMSKRIEKRVMESLNTTVEIIEGTSPPSKRRKTEIGSKEFQFSSELVIARNLSVFGTDLASVPGIPAVVQDDSAARFVSEPLPHWFMNFLNTYLDGDRRNQEDQESWLMVLNLLESSMSQRFYFPSAMLHVILNEGVQHETCVSVRTLSSALIRKMVTFLFPPDSKKSRVYYLRTFARLGKDIAEFDDSEPAEFLFETIENIAYESSMKSLPLIQLLVDILEVDFNYWFRSCRKRGDFNFDSNPPMLYRMLWPSGGSLTLRAKKVVDYYLVSLTDNISCLMKPLRRLVAIVAQIVAYKEWSRSSNDAKMELVQFFIRGLMKEDGLSVSETILLKEMYLLKPAWLSFSACNSLIAHLCKIQVPLKVSLRSALESYVQSVTTENDENVTPVRPRKITSVRKTNIKVDSRNRYGETPLHISCKRGDVNRVMEILSSHKANVNVKDYNEWTPLHEACANGHIECVKALLDYSRPGNIRDFLISSKPNRVDLLSPAGEHGITPFHDSVINNRVEIVSLLLNKVKSDSDFPSLKTVLDYRTLDGKTCLDLAQTEEMLRILKSVDVMEIHRPILIEKECFIAIRFLIANFLSKYCSHFGLHVQRDAMKSRRRILRWNMGSTIEEAALTRFNYYRSQETAVKDIRSLWTLPKLPISCKEIKALTQIFK